MKIAITLLLLVLFEMQPQALLAEKTLLPTSPRTNSGIASTIEAADPVDSSIAKEMALFTQKKDYGFSNESSAVGLIEIPLKYCNEGEVYLSLERFNSSVSTFIHLYFKEASPVRQLDSLFIVTHSHFQVKLPASDYKGLYQNSVCEGKATGKKVVISSPFFKAFYSANKRRMYIYMWSDSKQDPYEVTWIFENDKYRGRVLSKL